MSFDYFYGQQSDLFTFYRVPKVLFTNERFWNISADAKMLYGILLDRMSLSAKNGWIDKNGRVYIIFTIDEAKMALNCAEQKAIKLLSELEKKAGLIERKRQGLGKPNLIYVKNFISAVDSQLLNCENHNSGTMEITTQELPKSQCNNTDIKNTEFSDTDSIFPSGNGGMMDENDRYQEYFDYFSDQLSMDLLKKDYPYDSEMLDNILELIVETVCTKRPLIRIGAEERPAEIVRSRFMKLNAEHIRYDEKYNKWAYADLPIFPDQWKYQVSASTKKQFGILKKLMARKDVESLVCATDAGREGELIFRLVYQQAGCRKPFERLWISSMEDSAIREGFEQLKPSTEYDALYEAALCRERADWLVGINATRLFSTLYGQTLNVGRVMTPTLAMVVMREAAISAFRPEPFYTVELAFQDFTASGERMKQKVLADDVARKCVGSVLNVTKAENKEKSEKPPALYDLTSLQRDANRVLGFTAQQTLDYTQSLYEKKLVTYPRTDSRYLTSDMKDMLPELIKSLFNIFPVEDVKNVPVHAAQVINDKKVSDHHAIIPTKEAIKCSLDDLPKGEQAILRLIATRLFCAVGEPFRYNESVIELSDGNYIFSAKGKTTVQSGWKIFSGKPADKDKEGEKQLPSLTVGEGLSVYSTEVKEGKTSPPKHFTEDTLLQSMETAGADEMPEDAERKGLGTPATRAATIEKLVRIGFLERKGDKKTKHLISTHKGTALVTVMPEQIQSPSMTADWEEMSMLSIWLTISSTFLGVIKVPLVIRVIFPLYMLRKYPSIVKKSDLSKGSPPVSVMFLGLAATILSRNAQIVFVSKCSSSL